MKLLLALVAFVTLTIPSIGIKLDRCSLASEMLQHDVPKNDLNKWACIAEHESKFNTNFTRCRSTSKDYGIFQINDENWCKPPTGNSLNKCNIECNSLVTDDISDSVKCALQIKKEHGWAVWPSWKSCSRSLPSIDDCF